MIIFKRIPLDELHKRDTNSRGQIKLMEKKVGSGLCAR